MLFLSALHHIEITRPLSRGFQITEGAFLTNDKEIIKKLISPSLREAMGQLEYSSILSKGCVIYIKDDLPPDWREEDALILLNSYLEWTKTYCDCLWAVRDNSVDCELGFLESEVQSQILCTSNFIASHYTRADGLTKPAQFSVEDLRIAKALYEYYLTTAEIAPKNINAVFDRNSDRTTRFTGFIGGARRESQLGIKISIYMTCLEILFSTDPSELTHKLSQRVACFLGKSKSERLNLFQIVKRAYTIRSKIVHGEGLNSNLEAEITKVSVEIDEILRQLFNKIVSDQETRSIFNQKNGELEKYFINMTFDDRSL